MSVAAVYQELQYEDALPSNEEFTANFLRGCRGAHGSAVSMLGVGAGAAIAFALASAWLGFILTAVIIAVVLLLSPFLPFSLFPPLPSLRMISEG